MLFRSNRKDGAAQASKETDSPALLPSQPLPESVLRNMFVPGRNSRARQQQNGDNDNGGARQKQKGDSNSGSSSKENSRPSSRNRGGATASGVKRGGGLGQQAGAQGGGGANGYQRYFPGLQRNIDEFFTNDWSSNSAQNNSARGRNSK